MKLHIKIDSILYTEYEDFKIKCIIRWINPLTGNIQRSVGVSRCNVDDTYNVIKGKRIAESRAKINMWKTFNKSLEETIKNIGFRHHKFICHEGQHLHDLINDVKTN